MDSRAAKPFVPLDQTSVEQFAADVKYYLSLSPRQLPSRYFYDLCKLPSSIGERRAETAERRA